MKILSLILSLAFADSIPIEKIRSTCEILTNPDVTEAEGYRLLPRKDLVSTKARQICELIEQDLDDGKTLAQTMNNLNTLNQIYASFIDKHRIEEGVNLIDILKMGLAHDLSPFYLRTERTSEPEKTDLDITESIYWHAPKPPLANEFSEQMKNLEVEVGFKWMRLERLDGKGSVPKAHVTDIRNGHTWLMKWGDEISTDPVASRIFAALGYNVDLPHSVPSHEVFLILGRQKKSKRTIQQFVNFIYNQYQVNLSPFIHEVKKIDSALIEKNPELSNFFGETYLRMSSVAVEARPDIEDRLGGIMTSLPENSARLELRGALLAHLWIGNWDTKESNTLVSVLKKNGEISLRGSYSDLGVSLGVRISKFPRDLKAGLVNEFSWELIHVDGPKIQFLERMNFHSDAFKAATYQDLKWMATKIAQISPEDLKLILKASNWPNYLQKLYFFKLAERRRQILSAFAIPDSFDYEIDRNYSYQENGKWLVKDGALKVEPSLDIYPQGLLHNKGRFRGFGW